MGIIKHSQSSQNIKFAMSLQYFKKEVRDEVDLNILSVKVFYWMMLSLLMDLTKHC